MSDEPIQPLKGGSTSIERNLQILGMFSASKPRISIDDVVEHLACSKPTAYRHIKALTRFGMLLSVKPGVFALGPRIAQLDRMIRLSDPLLVVGRPIMRRSADVIPDSVLLLCRLAGDGILCIHADEAVLTLGPPAQQFQRERGVPFNPVKGAPSQAILAYQSPKFRRAAFERYKGEIEGAGIGRNWADFCAHFEAVRQRGAAVTVDTFHTGRAAASVPIFEYDGTVSASLSRNMAREVFYRHGEEAILADLLRIRQHIGEALMASDEK